jgi:hypothetical protein
MLGVQVLDQAFVDFSRAAAPPEQIIQNFIAVPAIQVCSLVPGKVPAGWLAPMPNLFFHQRYPPKTT